MTLFGIPDSELAIAALLLVLLYAFRGRILTVLYSWYRQYKEGQKMNELYARLDRNAAGRYSKKDEIKRLKSAQKSGLKKNREIAQEKREVQGK